MRNARLDAASTAPVDAAHIAPGDAASRPAPANGKPREIVARLEFPTARGGEGRPQALLALDLDGDGRDEIVGATMAPGALQIWSGLSAELRAAPEPRSFPVGDYPLGPVWIGGRKPVSKSAPALVAVASRFSLELSVIDLRAALAQAPDQPAPIAMKLKLDRRPRVIASGVLDGLGGSGGIAANQIAIVTIDDDLVLARSDKDVRHMRLCDDHATCARFLDDKSGIVFGFQGTRRLVIYVKSAMSPDVNPLGLEPGPAVELPGLPRALDEVDLDSDGDTELAVAGGDKSVWVFGLGRPGGWKTWFDAPPLDIETSPVPIDLAHADFDRDGKTDLMSLSLAGQECALYAGASFAGLHPDPKSAAIERRWRVYAGQQSMWSALGDFDGDGNVDVAISNPGAKRVSVLFGDGHGGVRTAERVASGRSPQALASGDLDGDGYPEVVGLNKLEDTLSVYKNDKGVLQAGVAQGSTPNADAVRCADVDGDGKLDAAFLQHPRDVCSLVTFFGDGRDKLAARKDVSPPPVGTSAGDLLFFPPEVAGRLTALVADPERNRLGILSIEQQSGKNPRFATTRYVSVAAGPRALALLHDRQGTVGSIAVALGGPAEPRGIEIMTLKHEQGAEIDIAPAQHLAMTLFPIAVAEADLDGDGELDLAVLAMQSGPDSPGFFVPWMHLKSGEWQALDPLPTGQRPYRIAAGDLDGDGRAEILVSAQNSHHVNLWTSRAGAPSVFARGPDLGVGTGPLDLTLVDLDRDGVPEIVVADTFSNELSVIRVR